MKIIFNMEKCKLSFKFPTLLLRSLKPQIDAYTLDLDVQKDVMNPKMLDNVPLHDLGLI